MWSEHPKTHKSVKNRKSKTFHYSNTFFYIRRKYWNRRRFWCYTFWDVLDTLSDTKCLSVCMWHKFCGRCRAKTNWRNFMKFYIKLHLNINSCWLDFGTYRFKRFRCCSKFSISLTQRYRIKLRAVVPNASHFWNLKHSFILLIPR